MSGPRSIVLAALLMAASATTHAYTECQGKVVRIWSDTSTVWVWFHTGMHWQYSIAPVGPGTEKQMDRVLSLATTAMVSDRTVTVRFIADGVTCSFNQTSNGVWGMYLDGP